MGPDRAQIGLKEADTWAGYSMKSREGMIGHYTGTASLRRLRKTHKRVWGPLHDVPLGSS